MKNQQRILCAGVAIVVVAALLATVAITFWPHEERAYTTVIEGKIFFSENFSHGTYNLGSIVTDPEKNKTAIYPDFNLSAGLGRNTFTLPCIREHDGIFDGSSAFCTLNIWTPSGDEQSQKISLDRTGTETLSVSLVAQQSGEGGFRITATSVG
ncbi:MAG: hypothetical protein PWP08_1671 [Methanofollis sp.]|nr:hypothetical protein [Methanofollis sp.]